MDKKRNQELIKNCNFFMSMLILPAIGVLAAFYHAWSIATFAFGVAIWIKV